MKITCEYCGNLFDDTQANCPHCGAPNAGVVRKSGGQPITIEELKQWYASKGLPPYETTRFFIGQDYRKPKAFGIYKDEKSGNFVVYKNKADGSRAVRYAGTDEAYAVNELYQRLKQEIIQQKRANVAKKSGSSAPPAQRGRKSSEPSGCLTDLLKAVFRFFSIGAAIIFGLFLVFLAIVLIQDEPTQGYYYYHNTPYYYYIRENQVSDCGWVVYDTARDQWSTQYLPEDAIPSDLEKNKQAKEYYVGDHWAPMLCSQSFTDSIFYQDHQTSFYVPTGYYEVDDRTYYHISENATYGWYVYDDDDWSYIPTADVPEDLTHTGISEDFFFTPTWDSSTQVTDFEDSRIYSDYLNSQNSSSSSSDSSSSWDWDDDDDDWDWDWDSGDSWDSDWGSDWDSDW